MGSYDVAAPFFAEKLGRRLTSVRVPDRQADLQAYMEKERAAQESETFRIRYNQPGEFLGVELARALETGEVIALQGDRVPGTVSPIRVPFHGHTLPLPRGPFVLAQMTGVPIYPLFILRTGWRRYRIVVLPPRRVAKEQNGQSDRQAALIDLAHWWRDVLDDVLQKHWPRWLAFEEMFESTTTPANTPAPHR
jgi:lauroyl/myristoyl acyltransferase